MTPFAIGLTIAILAGIYAAGRIFRRWVEDEDEAPPGPLVFTGPRGRVKIDTVALADIGKPTGCAAGVLIGRHIIDTEDVVVDEATFESIRLAPNNGRFRSKRLHQDQIDYARSRTGGRIGYVGEWHMAERGHGIENFRAEWRRRLREEVVDFPHVLLCLVYPDGVRLWEGEVATGRIVELSREAVRQRAATGQVMA